MYRYKIVKTELWGNAKDGFDSNDWHCLQTITRKEPITDRWLLRIVRDLFEGRSFAWSENCSRPMSRKGIEINDIGAERMIEVSYRGHYVGEVQMTETNDRVDRILAEQIPTEHCKHVQGKTTCLACGNIVKPEVTDNE